MLGKHLMGKSKPVLVLIKKLYEVQANRFGFSGENCRRRMMRGEEKKNDSLFRVPWE